MDQRCGGLRGWSRGWSGVGRSILTLPQGAAFVSRDVRTTGIIKTQVCQPLFRLFWFGLVWFAKGSLFHIFHQPAFCTAGVLLDSVLAQCCSSLVGRLD